MLRIQPSVAFADRPARADPPPPAGTYGYTLPHRTAVLLRLRLQHRDRREFLRQRELRDTGRREGDLRRQRVRGPQLRLLHRRTPV